MSRLKIVIDLGSSATKVVYTWGDRPVEYLLVSPYCAVVSSSYVVDLGWDTLDEHIESSWVQVGEQCALLGERAERFYGSSIASQELKAKKAFFKVFGILGYLLAREEEPVPVDLGLLLPFDEYLSREWLLEALSDQAQSVSYCHMSVSIQFNDIRVLPEGAGLALGSRIPEKVLNQRLGIVVIGHRNASWLCLEGGKPIPSQSSTNNLGFRWLVEDIRRRTGYKDELGLTKMLFFGEGLEPRMAAILKECLPIYWEQLEAYFAAQTATDYVLCGGGTGLLFKSRLKECFGKKLHWPTSLAKELKQRGIKDGLLQQRLADAYGVLLQII